ncbi:hypothetical protein ACMU6081_27635 [Achromobacter mucicolens]
MMRPLSESPTSTSIGLLEYPRVLTTSVVR